MIIICSNYDNCVKVYIIILSNYSYGYLVTVLLNLTDSIEFYNFGSVTSIITVLLNPIKSVRLIGLV